MSNPEIIGDTEPRKIKIVDFDMPFISMIKFMIKWSIASVPAFIIIFLIGYSITSIYLGINRSMQEAKTKQQREEVLSQAVEDGKKALEYNRKHSEEYILLKNKGWDWANANQDKNISSCKELKDEAQIEGCEAYMINKKP